MEAEQKKFSIIDGGRFAKAATGAEYKRFFFPIQPGFNLLSIQISIVKK